MSLGGLRNLRLDFSKFPNLPNLPNLPKILAQAENFTQFVVSRVCSRQRYLLLGGGVFS